MHCIVDRNANVADAASPGIGPDAVRIKLESQAFLSQFHFRFAHVWDLVYPCLSSGQCNSQRRLHHSQQTLRL